MIEQSAPTTIPRPAMRPIGAAVMILAALMDMLDVTIVNVALPTIRVRLGASAGALEWIVSGYMLTFAAGLIAAGQIGDRWGRRRMFLVGSVAFGASSLLSGLSQTPAELVACRLAQGAAAAILIPQVLATIRSVYAGKQRAALFGVYGAVAGLAAALGVVLGGVLTQYDLFGLGWRAIFLVNVPVAAIVVVAGAFLVPETRRPKAERFDGLGALALAAGIAAVVYPLLEGQRQGWPVWCVAVLIGGILVIAGLAVAERRRRSGVAPLLQTATFSNIAFSAGVAIQLLFSVGLQGFSLAFTLWVQDGHGYSPLHTGVTLLAFSAGAILTAPNAGKLALTHGRRVLGAGGLLMVIGTIAIGAPAWLTSGPDLTAWWLVPGLVVSGAGLGLLVVPLVNVVLAAVPAGVSGGASGLFATAQQLGGAVGVAVIGGVFLDHFHGGTSDHAFGIAILMAAGCSLLCTGLSGLLPQTAVADEAVIDAG